MREDAQISKEITPEQRINVLKLLEEFEDIFTNSDLDWVYFTF